jgi:hypothetical protein
MWGSTRKTAILGWERAHAADNKEVENGFV